MQRMNIDAESAKQSEGRFEAALEKLDGALKERPVPRGGLLFEG